MELLRAKFAAVLPHLDERQQRLVMAGEARCLGHGGIAAVARATGASRSRISQGVAELEAGAAPSGRVRRRGGGRKAVTVTDPALITALLALVEPTRRGDPESSLCWTTLSTRRLAAELSDGGHRVGADTVARLLREQGFSLQGNAKTLEGKQNPDRDAQFGYINEQVRVHQAAGDPVVSVDTKKKELVGPFKNGGREWRPAGAPRQVRTHDFPDAELGKVIPYGIYDIAANTGWVNVGTDHDTAAFAVESLRRWWNGAGREGYPQARRLLVTADAGGSNGYRTRAWKAQLAGLAAQTGLQITVCHFPPGTSKWNHIEHRLFCHITMNWRGRPLTSHEVVVATIAATTTRTGLRVHAELDTSQYTTGETISDTQLAALSITRHDWHGDWNYTLHPEQPTTNPPPTPTPPAPATAPPAPATAAARRPSHPGHTWLFHPALTGLPPTDWDTLITRLSTLQHRTTGRQPTLTLADHALAAILHRRFRLPSRTAATLLGVSYETINKAIRTTNPLLAQAGHTPQPTTTRIRTLADLTTYAATAGITPTSKIKPAC